MSKPAASRGWICAFCIVPLVVVIAAVLSFSPGRKTSIASTGSLGSSASLPHSMRPTAHNRVQASYASLPLAFEPNQGQTDPQVKYLARGHGYTLFLTANDAVFSLHSKSNLGEASKIGQSSTPAVNGVPQHKNQKDSTAAVHMHLVGANSAASVAASGAMSGTSNYFIGNDPSKWRSGVARYARVAYQNVYPGVEMAFHGAGRELEFDFVVAPDANPARIGFQFSGNRGMKTDDSGDLIISSAAGNVLLHKPVAYQEQNGARQPVDARFVLKAANQVSFELGNYDRSRELVIDPSVTYAYSTYLGGSGDDYGISITSDSNGNAYVTGETTSSGFPGANGALHGMKDAFVAKLGADGSSLIYFTYVGGSQTESGNGIAVDASGDAFVVGGTQSSDFPASPGAFQTSPKSGNAGSAFLFELSPDGRTLNYSTYLGGSIDDVALSIALDSSGNAYIGGTTSSLDFPIPSNLVPLQSSGGANDGFVAEINPGGKGASDLKFSTYLGPGGSAGAGVKGIAVDSSGKVYVTGSTTDATFHVTSGAYQAACGSCAGGIFDAFVTVINPTTNAYVYSTFLGGAGTDIGYGIAVDSTGDAYVTGSTTTATSTLGFPASAGAAQTVYGTNTDAFITKLNPTGTAILYSTYLGGTGLDSASGIAVDKNGNAYLTGSTSSTTFPVVGATQAALAGGSGTDAFVTEINAAGSQLLFSTYLGGTGAEDNLGLGGIAVDNNGTFIYVTGNTSSTDFPVSSSAHQGTFGGGAVDAFVVKYAPGAAFVVGASTPAAVSSGSSATSTVTVTALNGYASAVNLTCSVSGAGTPAPACSLSPTSVTPAASPGATSTLTITTTANHAENFVPRNVFYALWMPIAGLSVVGMSLTSTRQRRKKLMGFLMLGMILTTLLLMLACGGSSSSTGGGGGSGGTPAGAYTVTITGTGTDPAAITQSTQITLTVN